MKKFIVTSFILLFTALLMAVGLFWYVTQSLLPTTTVNSNHSSELDPQTVHSVEGDNISEDHKNDTATPLTAEQSASLEAAGVDTSTVKITPGMIDCAENILGEERATLIAAGREEPTTVEIAQLLFCLDE